jgi:hypothetical protein
MHPPKRRKRLTGMSRQRCKVRVLEIARFAPQASRKRHKFRVGMSNTVL